MLSKDDVQALELFRNSLIDAGEEAADKLASRLAQGYPKMDTSYFLDLLNDVIDEWTYEAMVDEEEVAEQEEGGTD